MNVSLFFLYIFQTVKCYGCQDNDTFEDELKVSINTKNCQCVCQGGKDQHTGYNSGDLTDTTGKISGVVTGVLIFTSLTYSLTILGIDTNLQFIFEGIIILAAVTLDCLKYVQKK